MGASSKAARFGVVVSLLFSLLISSPAMASEWDEVEFNGSGWGHGVGLSQYGARAMAKMGKTYSQILSHYFKGTSLSTLPADRTIWVNLERNFTQKTLNVLNTGTATGTPIVISSPALATTAEAVPGATIALSKAGAGCSVVVTNPSAAPVTLTDSTGCAFDFTWYQWNVSGQSPTTKVEIAGCTLPDWNTPGGTVFRPCQYARGTLHLRQTVPPASNPGATIYLHLSAEMLIDDYMYGISEVPYTWETEALKAQIVAARSYAEGRRLSRINLRRDYCWCHVVDTSADQRYVGWGHYGPTPWMNATQATARQVLTHPAASQGVITAFYSSSSGGATEYGHEVGYSSGPVEWLSSVDDSWAIDGTVANPNAAWTVKVNAGTLANMLGLDWLSMADVVTRRPGSGSAKTIVFTGMKNGETTVVTKDSQWVVSNIGLKSHYFDVDFRAPGDEMFFYRATDGGFAFYDMNPNGSLGTAILSGSGYSTGWDSISAVDLDGDGQDEMFFYRSTDGAFRYYDINTNGSLGAPILSGTGYSTGWDSISAVDLDGDGQDEMFFYRSTDGAFRYYNIRSNGQLGSPILSGTGYSTGWDSITAVDLDGDGQDEMFFYRSTDGAFRYYNLSKSASLTPILTGTGYSKNWNVITAVDLDGDLQDEMLFYRNSGSFSYYNVKPNGQIGSPLLSGTGYSSGWTSITAINLDGS